MKFKVEFEIEETCKDVTEDQMLEFLNFELGVHASMSMKNPLSHACLTGMTQNVKITKHS